MSKVTRWFAPDTKPVHVGIYETRRGHHHRNIWLTWWDGKQWLLDSWTSYEPVGLVAVRSGYQDRLWRGLKEKPE